MSNISSISVNNTIYDLKDKNALPITGGTLTGQLVINELEEFGHIGTESDEIVIKSNYADASAAANELEKSTYGTIGMKDKNDIWLGYFQFASKIDGVVETSIGSRKIINNSNINNILTLGVAPNGDKVITVSDSSSWRNALGASNGIWPISQGGTSATTAITALENLGAVNKTGDTMLGRLKLSADGLETNHDNGYVTDEWGNFIHKSTNTSNYWGIYNNAVENKFRVFFESGDVTTEGNINIIAPPNTARLIFKNPSKSNRGVMLAFAEDDVNNVSRFYFYQMKSSNSNYDLFKLPETKLSETTNGIYDILTTKSPINGDIGLNGTLSFLRETAQAKTGLNGAKRLYLQLKDSSIGPMHENYYFPEFTNDSTEGKAYYFLTTKNPVSIAQGGTGAKTAAAALDNLGAVDKAGDTMTGELSIKASNLDSTTTPTSIQWGNNRLYLRDKSNVALGQLETFVNTNGAIAFRLGAHRVIDGENKWNQLDLYLDKNGTPSYRVSNAEAFRNAIGAFPDTGGTIDGNSVKTKNKNIDTSAAAGAISGDHYQNIGFTDKNDRYSGFVESVFFGATGATRTQIAARRYNNNANANNFIALYMYPNGTQTVSLSSPLAWRNALELNDSNDINLAYDTNIIASGTLKYRKIGKLVQVSGQSLKPKTAITDTTTRVIATMPSGYRPENQAHGMMGFTGGASNGFVWIATDGKINFIKPSQISSLTANIYFTIMYFIP